MNLSVLCRYATLPGQYGLSFFVAMVNGAIVDLLVSPLFVMRKGKVKPLRQGIVGACACLFVFAGFWGYGHYRLSQSEVLKDGPVIGVVQRAFPISLFEKSPPSEKIFYDHYVPSLKFKDKNCDLVVWPETMLAQRHKRKILADNPRKCFS